MTTLLDRILRRKDDTLPIVPYQQQSWYGWPSNLAASWTDITPETLAGYYTSNPIAHACIRVIADSFSQGRIKAYKPDTDEEIERHPATLLFRRPNGLMGQSEFWRYVGTYTPFGGNCYSHIVFNRGGLPAELWPYSILQMVAVPSTRTWVDHYAYNLGSGQWLDIRPEEVVHNKWAVDPNKPWTGFAPMTASARAIDTHNEFTRARKVLLENDATPRTALKRPPEAPPLTDPQKAAARQDWRRMFAGDQRSTLAILEGGADLVRLALNMDELQASELVQQLEADICASFGIHPIIAKVKLGLDKSTYSNYEEAVRDFTISNLIPFWESVASEFTNALQPFYGDNFELRFDFSQVRALKEDQNALEQRVAASLVAGLRNLNESRRLVGDADLEGDDGEVWYIPNTVTVQEKPLPEPEPEPVLAAPVANGNGANGNGAGPQEALQDMPVMAGGGVDRGGARNGNRA